MGVDDAGCAFDDEAVKFTATDPAAEGCAESVQEIEDLAFLGLQLAPLAAEELQGTALADDAPDEIG